MYTSSSIDVRRASSQAHYAPHLGLPKIDPVTKAIAVNTISAALAASPVTGCLHTRHAKLAAAMTV